MSSTFLGQKERISPKTHVNLTNHKPLSRSRRYITPGTIERHKVANFISSNYSNSTYEENHDTKTIYKKRTSKR